MAGHEPWSPGDEVPSGAYQPTHTAQIAAAEAGARDLLSKSDCIGFVQNSMFSVEVSRLKGNETTETAMQRAANSAANMIRQATTKGLVNWDDQGVSNSTPEYIVYARTFVTDVWLYTEFWGLESSAKSQVFVHELTHTAAANTKSYSDVDLAKALGYQGPDQDASSFYHQELIKHCN